jgi:uncharacterized paraquat-inducible protein A
MTYEDYICESCGFTSQEQRGVYNCPVCGTQMKVHRTEGRRGGLTNTSGKLLIYVIEAIVILPICLVFLNVFGIIVFIVILLLTRRYMNKKIQNKAIKTIPSAVKNPDKVYTCNSCGGNFKGQRPNCPHCGIKLNYNE